MKRWHWVVLGALTVVSLVAERLAHHEHHYWFTGIPAFFVIYGFIGCVAIIYLSKWYGKYWVQKKEDYYEKHGDADPHRARTGVEDPGAASQRGSEERALAGDPEDVFGPDEGAEADPSGGGPEATGGGPEGPGGGGGRMPR